MASKVIRELVAKLGVDADDAAVDAFDKGLNTVKSTMFAVVAAAGAATAAILGITTATANDGDAAAKSAAATGLQVESYQEIAAAAQKADVEVSQLDSAFQRQASAAQTAIESNKGFIETAAGTKISVLDATGAIKSQETLFNDVANAVKAASTEQERLAIVTAVYGRSGGELLPLLQNGADGISALRDEFRALGGVISEETARDSEEFNDALTDLKTIVTGLRNEVGGAFIPILRDAALGVKDWYLANKEIINQQLDKYVGYIIDGVGYLVDLFFLADAAVNATFGSWLPVLALVAGAVAGIAALFALPAIISFGSTLAAGISAVASIGLPGLLAIGAAVAYLVGYFVALFLAVQDVYTYFQGGDSVLGRVIEQFSGTDTVIGSVISLLETVGPLLSELWTLVQTFGEIWWFMFSNTTLPVLQAFGAALMFVGGILGFVFGEYIQFVLGNIEMLFEALTFGLGLLNQFIELVSNAETRASAIAGLVGGVFGGSAGAAAGALFAPSSESEAANGGGNTSNVTNGGNTYVIQGVGISADEAQNMIDSAEEDRNRQAEAAVGGIEI